MNEEAIKDAYDLFVKDGYGDSIEDFKKLIASNPEALKDAYDLFVKDGYGDSIENYKELMGLKKKVSTQGSQQPAKPSGGNGKKAEPNVPFVQKKTSFANEVTGDYNKDTQWIQHLVTPSTGAKVTPHGGDGEETEPNEPFVWGKTQGMIPEEQPIDKSQPFVAGYTPEKGTTIVPEDKINPAYWAELKKRNDMTDKVLSMNDVAGDYGKNTPWIQGVVTPNKDAKINISSLIITPYEDEDGHTFYAVYPSERYVNGKKTVLTKTQAAQSLAFYNDWASFGTEEEAKKFIESLKQAQGYINENNDISEQYNDDVNKYNLEQKAKWAEETISKNENEINSIQQEYDSRYKNYWESHQYNPSTQLFGTLTKEGQLESEDSEARYLAQLKTFMENTNDVLSGYVGDGEVTAWDAFTQKDIVDVFTKSFEELGNAMNIKALADKISKNGIDSLTDTEKKAVSAYLSYKDIKAMASEDGNVPYDVVLGVVDMIPFLVELAATRGVTNVMKGGVEKGIVGMTERMVSKSFAERYLKKKGIGSLVKSLEGNVTETAIKDLTTKELKNLTATKIMESAGAQLPASLSANIGRAFFSPSMWAGAYERRKDISIDDEGNVKVTEQSPGSALYKAVATQALETFSEEIFPVFKEAKLKASALGANKGLIEAGESTIKNIAGASIKIMPRDIKSLGKGFLELVAWDGLPSELAEEVFTGITQPLVTGEGSPADFFEAKNLLTTILTVAAMGGATHTVSIGTDLSGKGIDIVKRNMNAKAYSKLSSEQKELLDMALMAKTPEEQAAYIMAGMQDGYDKEKFDTMMNLVYSHNRELGKAVAKTGNAYYVGDKVYDNEQDFLNEAQKYAGKDILPPMGWTTDATAEKVNNIINETKTSEDYAIQKPSTEEGVLRPTEQEPEQQVELSGVRENQKVTEENKQEEITQEEQHLNELRKAFTNKVGDERLNQQVNDASKTLTVVSPETKFVVHETTEEFNKTMGINTVSGGAYDAKTDTIHINKQLANERTVAHEVFHAVLTKRIKSDKTIQDTTRRMMDAVGKSASPELKQYLDDFAKDYDANVQNEEKLSELIGKIASGYESLPKPSQSLIRMWLDKIAKMLRLKPFTDTEAVEFLNTMASKIKGGQEITNKDVKILPKSKGLSERANALYQAVWHGSFQKASRPSISDVRKMGAERGMSENTIHAFLVKELGYSEAEINDPSNIEGYDRMKNEAAGIADKSQQRGVSWDKTMDNVIKYVQKSKVYQDANDTQRENMIRDIREEFGKKEKKAPSVNKVLGKKPDYTKVNTMAALKAQIRLENRAGREAKADLNTKRKALAEAVDNLAKKGKLTANQARVIINKISTVNLDNPVMTERFIKYMDKVYENADYAEDLRAANAIRKAIKKLSKTDKLDVNLIEAAKKFATIAPSMVDNIKEYIATAQRIKEGVTPSGTNKTNTPFDIKQVNDLSDKYIKLQTKALEEEKRAAFEEMTGIDPDGLSMQDIYDILYNEDYTKEARAKKVKEKEKQIRDAAKKSLGVYSTIAESILDNKEDPFTGESIDISDNTADLARRLLDIDIDELSTEDALRLVDAITNFAVNHTLGGAGVIVERYQGAQNSKKSVKRGLKSRHVKSLGRFWFKMIGSPEAMFETVFGSESKGRIFSNDSGVDRWLNGKAKADRVSSVILDKYFNKFQKTEPNDEAFNTADNITERGLVAFMSRTEQGNEESEFNRRKQFVEQSIARLRKSKKAENIEKADLYQKVYDKLVKDSKNLDEVRKKADATNVEAVDWWVNEWANVYDRLSDVALNYYNSILGRDVNYNPDNTVAIEKESIQDDYLDAAYDNTLKRVYDKKSGVLMPVKHPKMTKDRVIDLSFDSAVSNSYKKAMMDVYTAGATQQVIGYISSKEFSNDIMSDSGMASYVSNRIKTVISRARGVGEMYDEDMKAILKFTNKLAKFGVSRRLGGISQFPKQLSPMTNTAVMTGKYALIAIKALTNKDAVEWMMNSGMAIANRGVESQIAESLDKRLREAAKSNTGKALDWLEDKNDLYLNLFLKNADILAARHGFFSYYLKALEKNEGIDIDSIDWKTHEINQEAADYAQKQVNRQQNQSDAELQGELFASKNPYLQITKKILFPFASFALNQKTRMYNDITTLAKKGSSAEERLRAGRSLTALGIETAVFNVMSYYIAKGIATTAAAIVGGVDDDDKEKEDLNRIKGRLTNVTSDLLSPIPTFDPFIIDAVNQILSDDKQLFGGAFTGSKSGFNTFSQKFGTLGIVADDALNLYDLVSMSVTGKYTKDVFGKKIEVQLPEDAVDNIRMAAAVTFLFDMGLLPTETKSLADKIVKYSKKKGESKKEGSKKDDGFTHIK